MAMTKAEKARMEELETALALCWPGYAAPTPMTREEINAAKVEVPRRDQSVTGYGSFRSAAVGWFYNEHTGIVTKGWSDGMGHNRDSEFADNASQNCGRMYRSRVEAAMAMRVAMSSECAAKLARVDRIIRGDSDPR